MCSTANAENHPLRAIRRALARDGMLIPNNGTRGRGLKLLVRLVKPLVVTRFVRQRLLRFVMEPNRQDLVDLKGLIEAGRLTPVLDRTYPITEAAAALGYVGEGHARAKVVLTV